MLCAAVAGCGSNSNSHFERFERLPSVKELVTVPLGEYVIPVPVTTDEQSKPNAATQVQMEFALHAAVLPENARTVSNSFARLEGRLRHKVIEVCRNTPVDDLLDPTLTALKTHLAESLKPFMGDAQIERIHIVDAQVVRL